MRLRAFHGTVRIELLTEITGGEGGDHTGSDPFFLSAAGSQYRHPYRACCQHRSHHTIVFHNPYLLKNKDFCGLLLMILYNSRPQKS